MATKNEVEVDTFVPPLLLSKKQLGGVPVQGDVKEKTILTATYDADRSAILVVDDKSAWICTFGKSMDTNESKLNAVTLTAFETDTTIESDDEQEEVQGDNRDAWSIQWSPDGSYLVIMGQILDESNDPTKRKPALWLSTTPSWLQDTSVDTSEPLTIEIDVSDYTSKRKLRDTSGLTSVFFPQGKSTTFCFLTFTSSLFQAEIGLPQLSLVASEVKEASKVTSKDQIKPFFRLQPLVDLSEWHSRTRCATFDNSSSTLVVSGSVLDTNGELVNMRASSLTVWRFSRDSKSPQQMDSTILKEAAVSSKSTSKTEPKEEEKASVSTWRKLWTGTKDLRAAEELIQSMTLSTNGDYVVLTDITGKLSIYRLHPVHPIVSWQFLHHVPTDGDAKTSALVQQSGFLHVKKASFTLDNILLLSTKEGRMVYARVQDDANLQYLTPEWNARHKSSQRSRVLAFDMSVSETLGICQVIMTSSSKVQLEYIQKLSFETFIQQVISSSNLEKALRLVDQSTLDSKDKDGLYHQIWKRYQADQTVGETDGWKTIIDTSSPAFDTALLSLSRVSDAQTVALECQDAISFLSPDDTRRIITTGLELDVSDALHTTFQTALDRLDTMQQIYTAEMDDKDSEWYLGAVYAQFLATSPLDMCMSLASEGRTDALSLVFWSYTEELMPHLLDLLSAIPPTVSPWQYLSLLPVLCIGTKRLYKLQRDSGVEVNVMTQDLPAIVQVVPMDLPNVKALDVDIVVTWFQRRIEDLDSTYGQLETSYYLARLAYMCIPLESMSKDLSDLLVHTQRLYHSIYTIGMFPPSKTLAGWKNELFLDPLLCFSTPVDPDACLYSLHTVFLSTRTIVYSLDSPCAHVCRYLLSLHPSDPMALEACTRIMEASAPSLPMPSRWIQSDTCLLQTAIQLILQSDGSTHLTRDIECWWRIFMCLPERTHKDDADTTALQDQVDRVSNLLIQSETLLKYDVSKTPKELSQGSIELDDLVGLMCERGLDKEDGWKGVCGDLLKVATLLPSEEQSQHRILQAILTYMVRQKRSGSEDLVVSWVSLAPESIPQVLDLLLSLLSEAMDELVTSESMAWAVYHLLEIVIQHQATSPETIQAYTAKMEEYARFIKGADVLSRTTDEALRLTPNELLSSSLYERQELTIKALDMTATHSSVDPSTLDWLSSWTHKKVLTYMDAIFLLCELFQIDSNEFKLQLLTSAAKGRMDHVEEVFSMLMESLALVESVDLSALDSVQQIFALVQQVMDVDCAQYWPQQVALGETLLSCDYSLYQTYDQITTSADHIQRRLHVLSCLQRLSTELHLSEKEIDNRKTDGMDVAQCLQQQFLLPTLEVVKNEESSPSLLLRLLSLTCSLDKSLSAKSSWLEGSLSHLTLLCLDETLELSVSDDLFSSYVDCTLDFIQTYADTCDDTHTFQRFSEDLFHQVVGSNGEAVDIVVERLRRFFLTLKDKVTSDWKQVLCLDLASRCEDHLQAQAQQRELESVREKLDTNLDADRFERDEAYRRQQLVSLAHADMERALTLAKRYQMNNLDVLLPYLKAILVDGKDTGDRQQEIERRVKVGQTNVFEMTLASPTPFASFLLDVWKEVDGKDHVAVLLVWRMMLECSKRLEGETQVFPQGALSKTQHRRLTLLFACLKKAKEFTPASFDAKRLCAVDVDPLVETRVSATVLEEALSVTTDRNVKGMSKVMQKLHQVPISTYLLLFLAKKLETLWEGDGTSTQAFDSCQKFMNGLNDSHLCFFYASFTGISLSSVGEVETHDVDISSLSAFQPLSSQETWHVLNDFFSRLEKRRELSDVASHVEREVEKAGMRLALDAVHASKWLPHVTKTEVQQWQDKMLRWTQAPDASALEPLMVELCTLVQSVSMTSLVMCLGEVVCGDECRLDTHKVYIEAVGILISAFVACEERYTEPKDLLHMNIQQENTVATSMQRLGKMDDKDSSLLHTLQASASSVLNNVQGKREDVATTIVEQLEVTMEEMERAEEYERLAVLTQVLLARDRGRRSKEELAKLSFGAKVKALLSTSENVTKISTDAMHLPDNFTLVVHELLAAETVISTNTLTTLLVLRSDIMPCTNGQTWAEELTRATNQRLEQENSTEEDVESSQVEQWWVRLLIHGKLSQPLLSFYQETAYSHIQSVSAQEDVMQSLVEQDKALAARFALLCPSDALRSSYHSMIFAQDAFSNLDLLLLRYDVKTLLAEGLYDDLVTYHVQCHEMKPLTSTGSYFVCALVKERKYMAAARVVCMLWHVSPMLYDSTSALYLLRKYVQKVSMQVKRKGGRMMELVTVVNERMQELES